MEPEFNIEQKRIAAYAKALSHPARIAIIQHLACTNDCVCGDIVNILPIAQSTTSQHLKELKKAGLIKGTIDGVSVCYCINKTAWEEAKEMIDKLFNCVPGACNCELTDIRDKLDISRK